MKQVLILATILAPIVLAIVQLFKNSVTIKKNIIPLIAFAVGVFVGIVAYPFTELNLILRIWAGAFAGLSATGLFEIGNYRDGYTKMKGGN